MPKKNKPHQRRTEARAWGGKGEYASALLIAEFTFAFGLRSSGYAAALFNY